MTSIGKAMTVNSVLEDSLGEMEEDTTCLLVIGLSNHSNRQAFEVILETQDGSSGQIRQTINADMTANLLLPFPRLHLSDNNVQQAIPSLSNKQFIVGKQQCTASELEIFWYREELLKNIKLTWREFGTRRKGDVDLRKLVLTEEMLGVLKLEEIAVHVALEHTDVGEAQKVEQNESGEWCVVCGTFVNLQLKVQSRTSKGPYPFKIESRPLTCAISDRRLALKASLQIQNKAAHSTLFDAQVTPMAGFYGADSDISLEAEMLWRHILVDGTTSVPLRPLDPGKANEEEVEFNMCFLSQGTFSLLCLLEERHDAYINTDPTNHNLIAKRVIEIHVD